MTRPAALVMGRRRYRELMSELSARGEGRRESGAFLLGELGARTIGGRAEVTEMVYYDDIDPDCLTGGITMHPSGLSRLNQVCRTRRLRVLGDIHTHPSKHVRQSSIDAGNPMVALPGHLAFIAPNYAHGKIGPHNLGAHRLRRGGGWDSYYGAEAAEVLTTRSDFILMTTRLLHRLGLRSERR